MRRPVSLLPRETHVGDQKTRLATQADSYGYTYGKH